MEEQIIALAKDYFYILIIAGGAIVVFGCIFDWKWITRMISWSDFTLIRAFIEELHGVESRYKFERFVTLICGVLLILVGIAYWYFYGCVRIQN